MPNACEQMRSGLKEVNRFMKLMLTFDVNPKPRYTDQQIKERQEAKIRSMCRGSISWLNWIKQEDFEKRKERYYGMKLRG